MTTIADVMVLESQQGADLNAIDEVVSQAEYEIDQLSEALADGEIRRAKYDEKVQKIRDEAVTKVGGQRKAAQDRRWQAEQIALEFSPAEFTRAALQGAAAQLAPLVVLWSNTPTAALQDHLADVVAQNNIPAAAALRQIWNERRDRSAEQSLDFARTYAKLKLPTDDVNARLASVKSMASRIDTRMLELLRGRRSAQQRLNDVRSGNSIGRGP